MKARHILAIDQGTTGNTVLILDDKTRIVGKASREFPQSYPRPGWVEHDPEEIMAGLDATIADALADADLSADDVAAIGITNQRETTLLWERDGGRPLQNAVVWQDRRTADRCRRLTEQGHGDLIRQRTGLVIDPYFSGTKLEWLLDRHDEARKRAGGGELMAGTMDTYVVWRLTGGEAFVTEPSNASRTLLYDINRGDWDPLLLDLFGVPRELLAEVRPTAGVFGSTRGHTVLPDGIPISGIAGDQQAALFGQACFEPGLSKCTYGTGAFLLLNTGPERVDSRYGILTTIAWQLEGQPTIYALEGSAFVAGAAVQWLRDGLGLIDSAAEIEALASEVDDADGVVFVPALAGLGAPHWRPEARAVLHGMTRGTNSSHIARATLDGIAFQIADLIEAMNADANTPIRELRVDGGAAANDLLMQIQADLARVPVQRPANLETTAWGAGFLAGLGAGIWPDTSAIERDRRLDRTFDPALNDAEAAKRRERWRTVVEKA